MRQTALAQKLLHNYSQISIYKGFTYLLSYTLLFIALIFSVEIALILLGIGDVVLPWTRKALEVINLLVFKQ